MKIEHNGYVYRGKEQIERAMGRQNDRIAVLQAQVDLAQQWAREQLDIHQPYTHRVDCSISGDGEELKARFIERLAKDLWCARCSNPWPCKHIQQLHFLKEITGRNDLGSLRAISEAMAAIPAPEPRAGQIDVAL